MRGTEGVDLAGPHGDEGELAGFDSAHAALGWRK
jgi:hypothetical protein